MGHITSTLLRIWTQHKGLSVQGQDKCPCRTAVDQRGEQTINCYAKNLWWN